MFRRELKEIPVGSPVVDYPSSLEECNSCTAARAFIAKDLRGTGIECGPGSSSNCYPLPLDVDVKYLDRFDNNEGCNQDYSGEFPNIDYKTTINEMRGIEDNSLDFIVHCHVIEHSRNPLQALELAYQKLKPDGCLIMAVPDKRYTFDKPRKLTTAKHIIDDYKIGIDSGRDLEHVHCCKKIWVGSGYKMIHEMNDEEIKQYLNQNLIDIHWHTYTDRSFKKLLYKTQKIVPWKQIKIIPRKSFKHKKAFIEFYVLLKK
ncbi:MAG: methyltransferase domain-containing protein [Muricomes sp.]